MVVATVLFALVGQSSADDVSEARDHYKKGTKAFELGAFDEAVTEYGAAYRLRDDPALLYNLGQAHRLANHPVEALRFYRLFLMKVPNTPNRNEVEAKIDELQRLVEQQKKTQNMPPDSVKSPGSTPTPTPPPSTEAAPAPTVAAQTPSRSDSAAALNKAGRTKKIAGGVVAGAGLVLVVGGIVCGVLAQQAGDKLTRLDQTMGTFDYNQEQSGFTDQVLESVLVGVGAAAVVTGAVLYVLGHREQRRARSFALVPAVGHGVVGAALEGSF